MSRILPIAFLAASAAAHAHEGHGLPIGSHWHASDLVGFLVLGAAACAAVWFTRK